MIIKRTAIRNWRGPSKSLRRPRLEISAGGIVYKKTSQGILVGMIKDAYGKWTFPKGHVRRGETFREAAERECYEEMGLRGLRPLRKLDQIDIWFLDRHVHRGETIHKFIHYYLFQAPSQARLRRTPPTSPNGEHIQAAVWVPLSEVVSRSSYKDLRPILTRALAVINFRERVILPQNQKPHLL